jgi:hypothetical protein
MRENQRVGSIRVNRVSADLQERGFEVFREDGLCSFDLVIHKNGVLLRVEVKGTSSKVPRGNVVGTTSTRAKVDCRKFDIMASCGTGVRYLHSRAHKHNAASLELTGPEFVSKKTTHKNLERAKRMMEAQQC